MSYIGSTPTTQSFIAGTDYFNGTGAQVAFTLSRSVNSVNDIEVIVNNVEQIPSGYSVSGTTLTFSAAPSAGTSNVYVRYLSTTNLSLAIPAGTSASFNTLAYTGTLTGGTGVVNFGSGQFYKDASGNVGIGTVSPAVHIHISGTGPQAVRLQSTSTNGQSVAYQVYAPNSDGSSNQWQVGSGITADNEWTVQDITSAQIVDRYFRGAGGSRSFYVNGVERAKIDVNGQFFTPFVGGSTVVADYGCRAWIKHNSSSIQGSANISSLVRNGVGDYTINFTVAMADAGYAPTYMGEAGRIVSTTASAMNYARILDNGTTTDGPVGIAIFR